MPPPTEARLTPGGRPVASRPGLRARKKARTRAQLQEQAVRLFRQQGYGATTIEQIAAAADVSPATVYRYFPTKSDLVIYDDLDAGLIAAYHAQPPELNAIEALRAAFRDGFSAITTSELEIQLERGRLLRDEPELRAAMLDELVRTLREMASLVAERMEGVDGDVATALAGAMMGIAIGAWFASEGDDWVDRFLERIDAGMALLEPGFRAR
jgi:AcrR family transcriptional regulator